MIQSLLDLNFAVLALLAGGALVLYNLIRVLIDPLRDVPGPFLARFTRWWYFFEIYKGSFERTDFELHKRHGPIVRVAPREYSIDDVVAAKTIYGHGTAFLKAPWYWAWSPLDPSKASLFSDLNPYHHGAQRRKFASAFSMTSLIGYEQFVNNCTSLLAQRFSEIASAGNTVDIQYWLQCYAFDVIGEITFADRFGFLDMGEDEEGVFKAIEEKSAYGTFVGIFPWVHRWLLPFLPRSGGHGHVASFTQNQILGRQRALNDPRNKERSGPPDIMTKLLRAHEEDPQKMTRADIFTMCQSTIGAGSDTTAITLSSIFYHLAKYPHTWRRLREEIDDAAKESKVSDPITFAEAQELPYLQAVIKEGLRVHPATGLPMQRVVPPEGTTIAGRFIPGGSSVGINSWVAHRNPQVFGKDAEEWRPERWLEGRSTEMEKYFLSFGLGSRTCIGKNISLLEMSKLVPQVVRKFEIQLVEETERDLRSLNRWFVKQQNFRGEIVARSLS